MSGDPRIRASDADRDRAATLLREHHAAGRLTAEEFHERLDRAMTAKTLGELDELMADLPAIDLYELPDAALRRQRGRSRGGGGSGLPWGGMLMAHGEQPGRGGAPPTASVGLPADAGAPPAPPAASAGLPAGASAPPTPPAPPAASAGSAGLPASAVGGGRLGPAAASGWPELSAGAAAVAAWAAAALTLVLIGLVTGVAVGGLSGWWVLAAIPAGAISLTWFVIRRSRH